MVRGARSQAFVLAIALLTASISSTRCLSINEPGADASARRVSEKSETISAPPSIHDTDATVPGDNYHRAGIDQDSHDVVPDSRASAGDVEGVGGDAAQASANVAIDQDEPAQRPPQTARRTSADPYQGAEIGNSQRLHTMDIPVAHGRDLEDFLLPVGSMQLPSPLVDFSLVTVRSVVRGQFGARASSSGSGPPFAFNTLLVAGLQDGSLRMYDAHGKDLGSGANPLKQPVPSLAHTVAVPEASITAAAAACNAQGAIPVKLTHDMSDEALVTVLWSNGCVVVYSVSVWMNGKLLLAPVLHARHQQANGAAERRRAAVQAAGSQVHASYAPEVSDGAGEYYLDEPCDSYPTLDITAPHADGLAARLYAMSVLTPADLALGCTSNGGSNTVTAMYSHSYRGRGETVVGFSCGSVAFFMRNGTLIKRITSSKPSPVLALPRADGAVAVVMPEAVAFISLFNRQLTQTVCLAPSGMSFSSFAVDRTRKGLAFAGTNGGDMLMFLFDSDFSDGDDEQQPPPVITTAMLSRSTACDVSFRSAHRGNRVVKATVLQFPGYVLSLTGDSLTVHNSTLVPDFPPSRVLASQLTHPDVRPIANSTGFAASMYFTHGPSEVMLAASSRSVPSAGPGEEIRPPIDTITVYKSLLPYDPPSYDIMWMRTPIRLLGVVVFVLYHWYKRRKMQAEEVANHLSSLHSLPRRGVPVIPPADAARIPRSAREWHRLATADVERVIAPILRRAQALEKSSGDEDYDVVPDTVHTRRDSSRRQATGRSGGVIRRSRRREVAADVVGRSKSDRESENEYEYTCDSE